MNSSISPIDHARLIAASEAAHQRMADRARDRALWSASARHDAPVHISVIIRAVLARLGLPMPSQEAEHHG